MILKGRLFWKILLGFWLAIVLVSQLLWLGFRAERAPPEEYLAQQLASLARQARQAARYREIGAELRRAEGMLLYLRWREADEARLAAEGELTDRTRKAGEAEFAARGHRLE